MSKMSAPEMDVIRFNENDVIVASNGGIKTLSITGIGTGDSGDALFVFGGNGGSWTSLQVASRDSLFVTRIERYLGIESYDKLYLEVPLEDGGIASIPLGNIAQAEYTGSDKANDSIFNVSYTWNGYKFKKQ